MRDPHGDRLVVFLQPVIDRRQGERRTALRLSWPHRQGELVHDGVVRARDSRIAFRSHGHGEVLQTGNRVPVQRGRQRHLDSRTGVFVHECRVKGKRQRCRSRVIINDGEGSPLDRHAGNRRGSLETDGLWSLVDVVPQQFERERG